MSSVYIAEPSVSIVIPTRDRPCLLREALSSLSAQTSADFEVIVVDDASSPAVCVDSFGEFECLKVRTIRHDQSVGGYEAKNAGVRAATGSIVTFLDDDDMVEPSFVKRLRETFASEPTLDVLFVSVSVIGADAQAIQLGADESLEKILSSVPSLSDGTLSWLDQSAVPALLNSVPIAFQRPAFRRETFFELGGFLPCKTMWECEWAIKAVCLKRTAVLKERLHRWRVDGQGYFTGESRAMDVAEASVQIKDRLYGARSNLVPAHKEVWFQYGLAESWFVLAYQRARSRGPRYEAFVAWYRSITTQFSWHRFRFLMRLMIG